MTIYIPIEGIATAGKSTLIKNLMRYLDENTSLTYSTSHFPSEDLAELREYVGNADVYATLAVMDCLRIYTLKGDVVFLDRWIPTIYVNTIIPYLQNRGYSPFKTFSAYRKQLPQFPKIIWLKHNVTEATKRMEARSEFPIEPNLVNIYKEEAQRYVDYFTRYKPKDQEVIEIDSTKQFSDEQLREILLHFIPEEMLK